MKISMSEITTLPAPLEEDLPAFAAAGFDVGLHASRLPFDVNRPPRC